MSILRALRFPVLLVSLLVFGLIAAISGNYAGSALAQETSGTVLCGVVYSTMTVTRSIYAALLVPTASRRKPSPWKRRICRNSRCRTRLPAHVGGQRRRAGGAGAGCPRFSQFDLIVIAADTGADDQFSEAGLVEAIQNSGLPVVRFRQAVMPSSAKSASASATPTARPSPPRRCR
ncbi:MAG: hypothetical protein R2856_19825 [Caldilineaceae bacterium]